MKNYNLHIDIQAEDKETFVSAVQMAFENCHGGKARAFYFHDQIMTLFWCFDDARMNNSIHLPYPMDCEMTIDFLWGWLKSQNLEEHPEYDEFMSCADGEVIKGWHLESHCFGMKGGSSAFLTVSVKLVEIGK